jgi:hypothetical protein
MAATAQDSTAPLRSAEGKKDEDREEDSAYPTAATIAPVGVVFSRFRQHNRLQVLSVDSFGRWIKQHAAYVGQACCGGLISLLLWPCCVWCS